MKILRGVVIALMGLTAVFTILGGAGTSCVAFAAEKWESMAAIVPYKWVYILFVLITLAIGVMGARATVMLIKGKQGAFRYSIFALVAGIVIGVIHILVSRSLRGSSMPVDGVVYMTVLTLVVFLIIRIPAIWKRVDFAKSTQKENNRSAAAFTLVLCGIAVLTAPIWGASTHTFITGGMNWANAWPVQLNLIGLLLCLGGVGLITSTWLKKVKLTQTSEDILNKPI